MPSHHIVLRFSLLLSCYLCLGLPSGVLIWGHCVLEIQCVNVCLYWNYYYVVTSRTFLGGVYAVSWGCYTWCLWWLSNWNLFVASDKTHSCLGIITCYSDSIISFSRQMPTKLTCPQCYQPFWWFLSILQPNTFKLSYPQYQLFCQPCHSLHVNTFTFPCPHCYEPFWWFCHFLQANTFIQSLSCMYVITESYYINCVISMA